MKDQNQKSGRKGNRGGKPHYNNNTSRSNEIATGSNDVHWYGSDEIIQLAGRLSFFKALGSNVELFTKVAAPGNVVRSTVPGIMFIDIMDTLPRTSANPVVDAINVASKQQYALIRKSNSGAKNYEWNDLIVYEMARSSLNEIYAFLCRAYGVSNTYSMQNKYLPRDLLRGMGFDADDFISNLASIRLYINNLGKRINSLALPHSLSYFERKAWLYSHIFTDATSAKAQYYVLTPGSDASGHLGTFLKYNVTSVSTGGALQPVSIFQSGSTFQDWKLEVDAFVDVLLGDDDAAIISGDILKAYGDDKLFKCNPIPEDFITRAVCDYEVLQQIENLTVAPNYYPITIPGESDNIKALTQAGWIVQDGAGNLLAGPTFNGGSIVSRAQLYQHNPMLNFHKTDVTPADVMVGTRLTTTFGNYYLGTDNYCYIPSDINGTEIVTRLRIMVDPGQTATSLQGTDNVTSHVGLMDIYDISVFDWRPKVLFFYASGSGGGTPYIMPPLGDYETYRVLLDSELQKLHETATLNMFAVPLIENYAR